ncbi:hypothetical protein [Microcoleus sp. Pol7_A1]|uniref:hypothetical protein n=1 Tax=Microcoleus sp. Pol7_A1 TaxID=2818893 RepID=UPI002FD2463E
MPVIIGIAQFAIALTTLSSLKQAKSSAEPPPRLQTIASALPSNSTRAIARAIVMCQ